MTWKQYKEKFIQEAGKADLDEDYIISCLKYAQKLFNKGLPIIYDQIHLSYLTGYSYDYLLRASNASDYFYKEYKIPKKKEGFRIINEPLTSLKEIQYWILDEILNKCKVSPNAKAYISGRSIKDNARFHRNQETLLTLDIENFFPSLHKNKVLGVFKKIGYTTSVATMLSELCCLNDFLPQGSPTSPLLSNIILNRFDKTVFSFCKEKKIRYTRYADDMAFSGTFNENTIINFVGKLLERENLALNKAKIRIRRKGQRQEVTGVVVNEKLQVPRDYRKQIRQEIYFIKKFGIMSHITRIEEKDASKHILRLIGKLNFILFINPKDEESKNHLSYLHILFKELN